MHGGCEKWVGAGAGHGVGDLQGSHQLCGLVLGRGSVPSAGNTEMNNSLCVCGGGEGGAGGGTERDRHLFNAA